MKPRHVGELTRQTCGETRDGRLDLLLKDEGVN
jgi:hypothetical protein